MERIVQVVLAHLASKEGQAALKQHKEEAEAATDKLRRMRIIPHEKLHLIYGPADGSGDWAGQARRQNRRRLRTS